MNICRENDVLLERERGWMSLGGLYKRVAYALEGMALNTLSFWFSSFLY